MRFLFQAGALLLAIAVFPLPINTGIATSAHSLRDSLVEFAPAQEPVLVAASLVQPASFAPVQLPVAPPAVEPAPQAATPQAAPASTSAAARTAVPAAPAKAEVQIPVLSAAPRPVRYAGPQAVIATDFEKGGLSEASFRTMARVDKEQQFQPEEKVLVIGDSLSIPLGKHLEEYFAKIPGIHFKRLGRVSSGLARPDFFDWENTLRGLADTMQPSTVVIMIGTNDNQSLRRKNGTVTHFGDKDWEREYVRRIDRLVEICRKNNPKVNIFWVGAPIMGRPDLTKDVKHINGVIQAYCERQPGCHYVDTWDALADEQGRFTDFLVDKRGEKVRVRTGDGVHLSLFGASILAGRCLQAMAPAVTVMKELSQLEPSG